MLIRRTKLLPALELLRSVVPAATTMPILTTVLGECREGSLFLTSTNLQAVVMAELPVEGATKDFLLDLRQWYKIVKAVDGDVDLTVNDYSETNKADKTEIPNDTVDLKIGSRTFQLPFPQYLHPDHDWPAEWEVELPKHEPDFCFNNAHIQWLLGCRYCCDLKDAANVKNNVLLESNDQGRWAVATDHSRLDARRYGPKGQHYRILLPHDNADVLDKAVSSIPLQRLDCWIDMPFLYCRTGNVSAMFRLQDNIYPDYNKILNLEHDGSVVASTDKILKAVKLLRSLVQGDLFGFTIVVDHDELRLELRDQQDGGIDVTEVVPCRSDLEYLASFNSQKLLDCLGQVSTQQIELIVQNVLGPLFVKPHRKPRLFDRQERHHWMVLMPLRVD